MKNVKVKIVAVVFAMFGMVALGTTANSTNPDCNSSNPKVFPSGNPQCPGLDQTPCCDYKDPQTGQITTFLREI